ncbi:MAG TPA: hypothetical protein VE194_00875 [Rubrobacter sp.]|nr:hypothetical protein [Rubrobacter sp.]
MGPQAEGDLRDPDRRGQDHRGDLPHGASLLWEFGPSRVRNVARFFAENPNLMRLLGTAQVVFGIWLAQRQYHGTIATFREPAVAVVRR